MVMLNNPNPVYREKLTAKDIALGRKLKYIGKNGMDYDEFEALKHANAEWFKQMYPRKKRFGE
ncbi:hypothetical protein KY316_01170 [Candidatus Woesearchaeota archaeon]|nr:hypothetical protein [Candidatus Woesearchaeota archaeon]